MRRVLHIVDSLGYNGVAAQVLALSRGLRDRGFEVHVVSVRGRGPLAPELRAAGVHVTQLGRRWALDPVAAVKLPRLLRAVQPDVLHTWDIDAATLGAVVAARRGRPLVVGRYHIQPWKEATAWRLERRLMRHARRQVTNSVLIRDWYSAHEAVLCQFSVIPFAVPPSPPSDVPRQELLRRLSLPHDARLIGVIGRLAPEKRVRDLIWAADLLRVLHDNLRLLIIGDGRERAMLEQYARLASDLEHVRFLGERSDVWRIMPHLDVLWNADEPRGQSIAVLEAMSAGVPVIASDTPFNRELIAADETGYLIPLHDRAGRATRARYTDRLFNDPDLAKRLAASERDFTRPNLQQMIERYAELYSE